MKSRQSYLVFTSNQVELEFGDLVFVDGRNSKNPRSKARTNNKDNSHMTSSRNQTQATLVGGERFQHCVIPINSALYLFKMTTNDT